MPTVTESTTTRVVMKNIRESEIIDRNAPELTDLFDHLCDALVGRHGITRASYLHLAPSLRGLSLKISASPPLRPLAIDFVENRRHELLDDLAERMGRPKPERFTTCDAAEGVREPSRAARRQYLAQVKQCVGEGWWHGFTVPTFGPSGRRGLFLINAPLGQSLSSAYIGEVRRDVQEFHSDFSAADLAGERQPVLAAEERALLLGLASGMRMEAVAAELGLKVRGAEDRLKRIRDKLGSSTTIEAVARTIAMGLIH